MKRHYTIILPLITLALLLPVALGAQDVSPVATVSSLYLDPVLNTWGNEVEWTFTLSATAAKGTGYTLEVTKNGEYAPTIVLHYGANGELAGSDRFPVQHGQRKKITEVYSGKVILSEGFPVPYDYLSPYNATLKKLIIKRTSGGMVFSYEAKREVMEISSAQALHDGMIANEVMGIIRGKKLRVIAVTKTSRDEATMVKQLWAEGIPWWIYEETPYRKSWLRALGN
jgi:hypothetical protein